MTKLYEALEESPELENLITQIQNLRSLSDPRLTEEEWLVQQQENASTENIKVLTQIAQTSRPEVY